MNKGKKYSILLILLLSSLISVSQNFTRQDTLRGSITPQRAWWDLTYYHLDISVDPEKKYLKGSNTVQYKFWRHPMKCKLIFKNL